VELYTTLKTLCKGKLMKLEGEETFYLKEQPSYEEKVCRNAKNLQTQNHQNIL